MHEPTESDILTSLAQLYGVYRQQGETDAAVRLRCKAVVDAIHNRLAAGPCWAVERTGPCPCGGNYGVCPYHPA